MNRNLIAKGIAIAFMGGHMLMASAAETNDVSSKWGPYIDLEGKLGTKRNIGEADIFLPFAQDSRTLYFANVRARIDDDHDNEGSIGVGVRHMLENDWNIGAYGFVDHRRTNYDNTFNQTTVGFEALGRDVDLRANIYTPFGNDSRTLSTSDAGSVSGGSLFVTTTVQEERALPGFDVEAGWRLPLFDAEDTRQVRVYLAGYRFSDDGLEVRGTRVRAEYMLAAFGDAWKGAQLTLGAEYQDDNARGGQSFVGARLRIPFGSTGASSQHLNAQERRMLAPIERDVDIVSRVHSRTLGTEKATTTSSGQNLVALASDQTADLPAAIAAAGANSTVVLSGAFSTGAETILQQGQTVMGSGQLAVRTASGRTANVSLPGAEINMQIPGFFGVMATVQMADNSTLTGMTIRHLDPGGGGGGGANAVGVMADGVSNARILNNTVTSTTSGAAGAFGIRVQGGASDVIVGNNVVNVTQPSSNATAFQIVESSAQAYGNTLSATGLSPAHSHAVFLVGASANVVVLPGSTGNVLQGGGCTVNMFTGLSVVGTVHFTDGTTCP